MTFAQGDATGRVFGNEDFDALLQQQTIDHWLKEWQLYTDEATRHTSRFALLLDAAYIGRQKWNTKSNRRAWGLPKDRALDGLYTKSNNLLLRFEDEYLDVVMAAGVDSEDWRLPERVRSWLKYMKVKMEKQRKKEQREENQRMKMESRRQKEAKPLQVPEDEVIDLT